MAGSADRARGQQPILSACLPACLPVCLSVFLSVSGALFAGALPQLPAGVGGYQYYNSICSEQAPFFRGLKRCKRLDASAACSEPR